MWFFKKKQKTVTELEKLENETKDEEEIVKRIRNLIGTYAEVHTALERNIKEAIKRTEIPPETKMATDKTPKKDPRFLGGKGK